MINNLKHNTKIKLISLLSAIVLWMYVMVVVDPEDRRLIENVPIQISNMNELKQEDLVLKEDTDLTADIYIMGKLSNLQKVKVDDIHINGTINDPIEGNNKLYLRANIAGDVNYELKTNFLIVDLDKVVQEKRTIDISVTGVTKDKIIDSVTPNIDSIKVSGPRTMVDKVQKVVATLDITKRVDDFSSKLKLTAVDDKGKTVTGVKLQHESINVDVKLLKQKIVSIDMKFKQTEQEVGDVSKYKISPNTITIKGKKDVIENVDIINTKPIDIETFKDSPNKEIELEIPEGIIVDNKVVTIELVSANSTVKELVYSRDEIQIRENENNQEKPNLDIPESIKVIVSYSNEVSSLSKSDINLYIDLSKKSDNDKYTISYESNYTFESISIEPDTIEIKSNS